MTTSLTNASADRLRTLGAWLIEEGQRGLPLPQLLMALVRRLHALGVPLDRLAVASPTLHPEALSTGYRWKTGEPEVAESVIPHGIQQTDSYVGSPFEALYDGADEVRRRLDGDAERFDFALLHELREEGYSDYLALALRPAQVAGTIAFATRRVGGFDEAALALLRDARSALSLVIRLYAAERATQSLLETYLGRDVARRIMTGQVRRGGATVIHCVLWYSDLRGFTDLSNRMPLKLVFHVLNDYFDAMITPIHSAGGEVLKLIGDGLLAVFRVVPGQDAGEICERALGAAEMANANMRRINRRRTRNGKAPLRYGLALHLGDVIYGNVGAATRLDFTVIGPAVNLASRLEGLAGELGRDLVLSAPFAERCPRPLVSIGRYELKGFGEAQEAFVPADARAPTD